MKASSVRDLPDDVHESLKAMAVADHCSVQEPVRCLVGREAGLIGDDGLSEARAWRIRLAGRHLGDTVEDVRQDRIRS
ncbi:MAG: hypothetical protein H7833_05535 [Magnetococcus sp. DMHC-1]|nr:hypothetical protein [Magnetococcales bacterium]